MSSKQARYEAFLDAQQSRHQARWFRDAPTILDGLTAVIQDLKTTLADQPNFAEKSLPKLRELYKAAMNAQNGIRDYTAYRASCQAISDMLSQINSWFRTSRVAVGVMTHMDLSCYGKARIADRFELLVSDSFDVTVNRIN